MKESAQFVWKSKSRRSRTFEGSDIRAVLVYDISILLCLSVIFMQWSLLISLDFLLFHLISPLIFNGFITDFSGFCIAFLYYMLNELACV